MKLQVGKLYIALVEVGLKWADLQPGEVLMVVKQATEKDTEGLLMYREGIVSRYTYQSDINVYCDRYLKRAKRKKG